MLLLAIRDGAFGAYSLRGLPAAGSLRSPLPLAPALTPTTVTASIRPDMMKKCLVQLFQKTASNYLNSPRHDEKVSNAPFQKNGLELPRTTSEVGL